MNVTLIIIGLTLALFLSTSMVFLALQLAWMVVIFFALMAAYLGLRSKGITWGRAAYTVRLFIYRHL